MSNIVEGEVVNRNPSLSDLNRKAIQKLYELVDSFDAKTSPEMIQSCTESIAKLNSSLKGSDILPKEETPEERADRRQKEMFGSILKGETK